LWKLIRTLRDSIPASDTSLWIHTMNRCTETQSPSVSPLRRALLALGTMLLLATSGLAHAQFGPRPFPARAERGSMVITQPPELLMNAQPARLSPGARIHGANNMLVLSGTLVGQLLLVNYVREPSGMVHEVWILTPAEAALKLPTQP
jgi:hypothetical protein